MMPARKESTLGQSAPEQTPSGQPRSTTTVTRRSLRVKAEAQPLVQPSSPEPLKTKRRDKPSRTMAPRAPVPPRVRIKEEDDTDDADSDSASDLSLAKGGDENAKGVGKVIQGLARMERRLQRAVKRQRIKVEESVGSIQLPGERKPTAANSDRIKSLSAGAAAKAAADSFTLPTPEREQAEEEQEGEDGRCLWKKRNKTEAAEENLENAEEAPAPTLADRGAARPPPVDSDYLPLPWKGRLGYACLNTYLRSSKPSVFSSRTCRMSSIIDHRFPLADPTQPEHPNKNRPDKSQKPDPKRGLEFVQQLGLANARDIVKMLRWNERYGIRFFRLSSEMFPFASHQEHGYTLSPFAAGVLAEAGKVAAEFGHRLTTHPGQFTQLGSPRPEVIAAAVRDLEYHDDMLSLLNLPEQQNRDAVMILHMGGVYGDKAATLDRFRQNYTKLLSDSIKRRLVLENDDMSWSVHDLLPVCEELNIPLVLDFHHHNIVFDVDQVREGTADVVSLIPRIRATWDRKGIRMKMHYSEPCAGAVTPRDRRKHSPRVATLPPCPDDVDLMIEAKDKEQAVFELMKNFKLPGHGRVRCMLPNERTDEPKPIPKPKKTKAGKKKKGEDGLDNDEGEGRGEHMERSADDPEVAVMPELAEEDIGMGGPEGRVYWPPGMEDWLKPLKRDQKRKFDGLEGYEDE